MLRGSRGLALAIVWTAILIGCSVSVSAQSDVGSLPNPTSFSHPPIHEDFQQSVYADATPTVTKTLPPELAVNEPCMTCHNLHPTKVVQMPHPAHPQCNACHSGSPRRMSCPSCHSTHMVKAPHPNDPNLACSTCHK